MKCCFCAASIVSVLFFCLPAFAQSTKVTAGAVPSWVVKNTVDYTKTSLDKEATEGSLDIYFEAQVSLGDRCRYIRQSKKLISQAGVQNESTISVSFDPTYQQLVFHSIQIIRKGEILNRLQLSKIKTVHQEDELDDFIYNGTNDAVLILEDTRPGDIIEYSYSIKGFNPVFKDKYSGEFNTGFTVPVYDLFYRLLVPKGRSADIKNINENIQPVITANNGVQVYEWRKSNIAPLQVQDNTPSWYNPFPRIEISEFKTWKEVSNWAIDLFPARKNLSAAAQKKIAEIVAANPTAAGKVRATLRFVQDDIRYMGIEMGRHSHKPADPDKVFAQRFGDCKEKSYLFCCMLAAMNIEASPVLINTEMKHELFNSLPSPTVFDHCTVQAKIDGQYYWFDPTIAYQRGNIKDIFYPDYQAGLVVGSNTSALTPIPFRKISYQHITDYFKLDDMNGSGSLVVTTNYKGYEADGMRNDFNNMSNAEIMNNNKKFYAKFYENIQADSLVYTDNDSTGIFITTEYYTLPNFWTTTKANTKKFTFSAFAIDGLIRRPKETDRKMPVSVGFPASYREDITVVMPEEWNVAPAETHLSNNGFTYNSKFSCVYNEVQLVTDYETKKDFVTIEESREYLANVKSYDETENYMISLGDETGKKETTTSLLNVALPIFIVMALFGIIGGVIWWSRGR